MPRMRKRRPKLLIINDISESKRHAALIRDFVRTVYAQPLGAGPFEMINASKIRKRVFDYLGKQPKFDLVLTGDRGGTLLFTDSQLLRFGKKVLRIPYSSHYHREPPWYTALKEEVSRLGKGPRVLLLEADVGPQLQTAGKLAAATHSLLGAREDADVHKVAGVVSRNILENKRILSAYREFNYIAYPTHACPMRLSELIGFYAYEGRMGREEKLIERVRELQKRRSLRTGTLPY